MRIRNFLFTGALISIVLVLAPGADGQRRNQREILDEFRSLRSKIDDFDQTLRFQLRSSSAGRQQSQAAVNGLTNLRESVAVYSGNLDMGRENRDDINGIITAARDIEGFLRAYPQNQRIVSTWDEVKTLIDRLSAHYGVVPDWNGRISNASRTPTAETLSSRPVTRPAGALTGTYKIDVNRSEDAAAIAGEVNVSSDRKADLEAKLTAPDEIALDVRGRTVILATSNASPVRFEADGRDKVESAGGTTIRVRATLRGEQLVVSSLGGDTDFTITFEPMNGGRVLKVSRRITTDYLNETIFAESFYNRTDMVARLGIGGADDIDVPADDDVFSSSDPNDRVGANSPDPTLSQPRIGEFIVPDGTVISGQLENEINTKISQNNDRFRMTVQSPIEFRGAIIEGYISGVGRSGQVSGRSNVTFNFERITLRNGRSYDFAGSVTAIKDQQGKDIRVDTEGTAKGDSQTKETAKRGGIGAGIGAVIGAIAGGGKGAILGAIIGGGAGAGSVIVGGRDDIRLMPGSTITVQASSPVRNGQPDEN